MKGSQARGARTLLAPPDAGLRSGRGGAGSHSFSPSPRSWRRRPPAGSGCYDAHLNDRGALLSLFFSTPTRARILRCGFFPPDCRRSFLPPPRSSKSCWAEVARLAPLPPAPSRPTAMGWWHRVIPTGLTSRASPSTRGRPRPAPGLGRSSRAGEGPRRRHTDCPWRRKVEVAALSPPVGPSPPQVVERGRLPREEVPGFLGRAAATLLTSSIAEAHPLVAIGSLAAGTPVVGFAVGGLPEIVDEATGIRRARDVEAAIAGPKPPPSTGGLAGPRRSAALIVSARRRPTSKPMPWGPSARLHPVEVVEQQRLHQRGVFAGRAQRLGQRGLRLFFARGL